MSKKTFALVLDPLALPLSTGLEESRRDGIETIEAIKAIKRELPGVQTVLGLSNVVAVRLLRAGSPGPQLNVLTRMRRGWAGRGDHRPCVEKSCPLHRIDERARQVCLDLIYDIRREGDYDPLTALIELFADVKLRALWRSRTAWIGQSTGVFLSASSTAYRNGLDADLERGARHRTQRCSRS